MPTVKLSDLGIQKLKRSEKHTDYFDPTLPTFGVRVAPSGTKTFILKLRSGRQAIGRYPILSLSEARQEAKRILAERTLGRIRPRSITYQQAVKLFIEDKKRSRRESTAGQYEWFLRRLDFGQLADITHEDIERQLKKITSKSTYDHVLIAARIFFNWCIKRRYVENNPTAGLSPHGTTQRARVLSDHEIKLIWEACGPAGLSTDIQRRDTLPENFKTIVKLLILTGQRRGEIAGLRADNIQNNLICLKPNQTKNNRQHEFPISALCAELLLAKKDGLIFPARGSSDKPFNGWSKATAALWKATGINGATIHDIRRTYRTIHGRIGTPPHIAERLVNHVSARTEVEKIYDQHTYLPEMKIAVDNFERYLLSILNDPQTG